MTSTTSTTSTTTMNEGKHIGYKKCKDNHIVVLEIIGEHNEGRKSVDSENVKKAKHRCSSAKVLRIYNMFTGKDIERITGMPPIMGYGYTALIYIVGEIITTDYDSDIENTCSSGIYYFLDEELAKSFKLKPHTMKYTGRYKVYDNTGHIAYDITYVNGTAIAGTVNSGFGYTPINFKIANNKIVDYSFNDMSRNKEQDWKIFRKYLGIDINDIIEDYVKYIKLITDVKQLYDNVMDHEVSRHNPEIVNNHSYFGYLKPPKYTYPMYPTYPTYYGMHAPRYPSFNPYYGFGYR